MLFLFGHDPLDQHVDSRMLWTQEQLRENLSEFQPHTMEFLQSHNQ